jgi:hypothetical protein
MKKRRTPIPPGVVADIEIASDRTCCVCRKTDLDYHIHHIDGNPSNHDPENLVLLCLMHHSEAGKRGGAGRTLSPIYLRKVRKAWYEDVRNVRAAAVHAKTAQINKSQPADLDSMVRALAVHDIRNLHREIMAVFRDDWSKVEPLIWKIGDLVNWSTGERDSRVHLEAVETLEHIVTYTRHKMPPAVGSAIENIVKELNPYPSYKLDPGQSLSKTERDIVDNLVAIGFQLAGDGMNYLDDLKFVGYGSEILWDLLRDAVKQGDKELKSRLLEEFNRLMEIAGHVKMTDASRWLTYLRDDAVNHPFEPWHDLPPSDILEKLH